MSAIYPPTNTTNILVNTRTQPKVVYLPAASTIGAGRLLFIKDICGNATNSSIYLSTTGRDSLDGRSYSSISYGLLSTNFQSVLLAPDGLLNWMVLQNYNTNAISRQVTFSPTQIAGLSVWLDASVSSSVTLTGSNVTLWSDRSGNGRNGTGTGTIGYTTNAINGLNALSFTAIDNSFIRGNFPNTSTTVTCFAIAVMTSSAEANTRILSLGLVGAVDYNSASYSAAITRAGSGNSFYTYRNGSGTATVAMTYGTPFLAECLYDGTNKFMLINGAGTSNASTGAFNTVNYQIGASFAEETSTNFFGFIGEQIMYTTALTTLQRQQVEGYLAWKWGTQGSLPANHPYKNAPP